MKKEQIVGFLKDKGIGVMNLARRGVERAKPIATELRTKTQEKAVDLYQTAKDSDQAQAAQRQIQDMRTRVIAQKNSQLAQVRARIQVVSKNPQVTKAVDTAQEVGSTTLEYVTPKVQAMSSKVRDRVAPIIQDKKDKVNAILIGKAVRHLGSELVNNPQTWRDLKAQLSENAPSIAHFVAQKINPENTSARAIYQDAFAVESLDQPKRAMFEIASVALDAKTRLLGWAATCMLNKALDSDISKQDIGSILAVRFVAPHLTSDIQMPQFVVNVGNQLGNLYQNMQKSIQNRFFPGGAQSI